MYEESIEEENGIVKLFGEKEKEKVEGKPQYWGIGKKKNTKNFFL